MIWFHIYVCTFVVSVYVQLHLIYVKISVCRPVVSALVFSVYNIV